MDKQRDRASSQLDTPGQPPGEDAGGPNGPNDQELTELDWALMQWADDGGQNLD